MYKNSFPTCLDMINVEVRDNRWLVEATDDDDDDDNKRLKREWLRYKYLWTFLSGFSSLLLLLSLSLEYASLFFLFFVSPITSIEKIYLLTYAWQFYLLWFHLSSVERLLSLKKKERNFLFHRMIDSVIFKTISDWFLGLLFCLFSIDFLIGDIILMCSIVCLCGVRICMPNTLVLRIRSLWCIEINYREQQHERERDIGEYEELLELGIKSIRSIFFLRSMNKWNLLIFSFSLSLNFGD